LKGGPTIAKPGVSAGSIKELRVYADDLIIRRRDATELFLTYHRKSGNHGDTVHAQAERMKVRLEERTWTVGEFVTQTLEIELEPRSVKAPTWRVWLRSLDENDYQELRWRDGRVRVPDDLGGVYLLRVSPEVRPWQGGTNPEYLIQTWVEIRKAETK